MDDLLQAGGAPREWQQNATCEPLSKDLPAAQNGTAAKASHFDQELDASPGEREVGRVADVAALHPARRRPAGRTGGSWSAASDPDSDTIRVYRDLLDDKAGRNKA
jgi:hypothetical protein